MTATRRTKGAGSIFKDNKGVWHFRKTLGTNPATGKPQILEVKGKIKSEARDRFQEKIAEYERTGYIKSNKSPYFKDYTERWLEDYQTRVKPNTYRTRAGRVKALNEIIGYVRLEDLNAQHVRQCMQELGQRLQPSTLREHYATLKLILDQAEIEELIYTNPIRKVKPPRVEATPVRILSPQEPQQFINTAAHLQDQRRGASSVEDNTECWALLFELAFSAGMRAGERYALMPYELERRDGVPGIYIQRQLQPYGKPEDVTIPKWLDAQHVHGILWLTTPKTRAAKRFVPISEALWQRLWVRIHRLHINDHEFVFTSARGNPIRDNVERYHWLKALEAAGLPQVKIHSARHWLATMAARANMPDDARISIMGHTSIDMTAHYTHRDAASLGLLLAQAIPPLRDDDDVQVIDIS